MRRTKLKVIVQLPLGKELENNILQIIHYYTMFLIKHVFHVHLEKKCFVAACVAERRCFLNNKN